MAQQTVDVHEALGTVGVGIGRLVAGAATALEAGRPYLVGSLAEGLGNRGSDIDIHVFTGESTAAPGSVHLLVDGVAVGVEYFAWSAVADQVARLTPARAATALGSVALDRPPPPPARKLLGRWLCAVPLDDGDGPVVPPTHRDVIVAHLLRATLNAALLSGALAELVGVAGLDAGYAWTRCQRSLLEMICVARGAPGTGEKWYARRVRRVVTAEQLAVAAVRSAADLSTCLRSLGLPAVEQASVIRLVPDRTLTPVTLAAGRHVLTRFSRLAPVPDPPPDWPSMRHPDVAVDVLGQLRAGLVRLAVDDPSLSARLA